VQLFRANQPATLVPVTDARLDLVLRRSQNRSLSLGVSQRGVSFGGVW
jgi:hypothetical protein